MKVYSAITCILTLLISGCASSPPSSTVDSEKAAVAEETVTKVYGADQDVIILRQPGGAKGQQNLERTNNDVAKVNLDSGAILDECPLGQLMATRIITGETGTRISEECVTPFSSKGRRHSRSRPVAIKIRNFGGEFKAERITRK